MATLLECNAVFLHVPKTGGSWVRHVLREQGLVKMEWPHPHPDMDRVLNLPRYYPTHFLKQTVKHRSLSLYTEIRDSYKFCFVRHPYSWYASYWRFMMGLNWKSFHDERQRERRFVLKQPWHPNAYLERLEPADFRDFMRSVVEEYPGYLTQLYGWYAPPGEIDFQGRTESLVDDLVDVLEAVGADFDEEAVRHTGKINASPDSVDRPDWDDDLREVVRRLEAPVFERYGYE